MDWFYAIMHSEGFFFFSFFIENHRDFLATCVFSFPRRSLGD